MKFCRHCGTVLQQPQPGLAPTPMMPGGGMPGMGGGMPGPMPGQMPGHQMGGGGMPGPMPGQMPGGPMPGPMPGQMPGHQMGGGGMPGPMPGQMPGYQMGGGGMPGQMPGGGMPGGGMGGGMPGGGMGGGMPGGGMGGGMPGGGVVAGSIGSNPGSAPMAMPGGMPASCPKCSSPTQPGFAFCQQCGTKLTPGGPAPAGIDAHGATLATSGPLAEQLRAGAFGAPNPMNRPSPVALAPTPAAGQAWGAAVSVNRDGSDGERYPLATEYVVVGRTGADIAFEADRFLGRQHARLEPTTDGAARVVPLDTLNGVYRKIDAAVELTDAMIVLAGREVLRFEKLDPDEKTPTPLIRHGVALFGSPPREPWGRLMQLLPSGGMRDIRHLWDDEVVIGREEGDLVFSDDQFLSRRHCSLAWDGTRAFLTDLGSSNGTFVRLVGPTVIKNGDHLRMGDQLFRIELRR